MLLGKVRQIHPADSMHDLGNHREVGVAVQKTGTGLEIEGLLRAQGLLKIAHGDGVGVVDAAQAEQLPLVANAAGVVHQVAHGDRFLPMHQVRQIGADIRIQVHLALFGKQQQTEDGDLFGHRCHMKAGGRGDWNVMLQIGKTEAAVIDDLSVVLDQHLTAGGIGVIPAAKYRVDAFCQFHEKNLPSVPKTF